jgi:tetratricopeptide (TPR) repeat protein
MVNHKLIKKAVLCAGLATIAIGSVWVVKNEHNHQQAISLIDDGLVLMGDGKIDDGVEKFSLADKVSQNALYDNLFYLPGGIDGRLKTVALERRLQLLKGICILSEESNLQEQLEEGLAAADYCEAIKLGQKKSEPWLDNPRKLNCNDGAPQNLLIAELYAAHGKRSEALRNLEGPAALFPWNEKVQEVAEKIYRDNKLPQKQADFAKANLDAAEMIDLYAFLDDESKLQRLNDIIARHPKSALPLLIRANYYHEYQSQYEKSLQDVERLIALYPNLTEAYYLRGKIHDAQGKYEESLADYSFALRTMPCSEHLFRGRIGAASQLGMRDQVLSDYDELIELYPLNPKFSQDKADYLTSIGEYELAQQALDVTLAKEANCEKLKALCGVYVAQLNTPDFSGSQAILRKKEVLRQKQEQAPKPEQKHLHAQKQKQKLQAFEKGAVKTDRKGD